MSELTPFGKVVRKIRIDRGETMGAMAEALGISSAFLSSLETGKRNVPGEFLDKLLQHCGLKEKEAQDLRRLALVSRNAITIKPKEKTRELAAAFSRKFEELDKEQIEEILKVLSKTK
jgi:transcriptional regulator with XRE-family HTH domain